MGSERPLGGRGLRKRRGRERRRAHGVRDAVSEGPIPLPPRLGISRFFYKFVSDWEMLETAEDDGGSAAGEEFEEEDEDGGAEEHERDAYDGADDGGGEEGACGEEAYADEGEAGGQEHFKAREEAGLLRRALLAGFLAARLIGAAAGADKLRLYALFGDG